MPSASSCFLLSFCFRKASREVSPNRLKNYRNYFYMETKTAPEGDLQGGPIGPRQHPGAINPLTVAGAHLGTSGALPSCPFANKLPSSQKPSIPDHIFEKTSEATVVANPRSGGFWTSSRHPAGGGDHHRRLLHHHACLRSDAWVVHHGITGPWQ